MASTLTARGKDGKQSGKIERNTRKSRFCAILLRLIHSNIVIFAWGLVGAQSSRRCVMGPCGAGQGAFAGKPAPTGYSGVHEIFVRHGHCGSGLAREEASSLDTTITVETHQ